MPDITNNCDYHHIVANRRLFCYTAKVGTLRQSARMKKLQFHCTNCPAAIKSIFCKLPRKSTNALDKLKTTNLYKAKQFIFYQNNRPFGIYHIYSGKVKVFKIGKGGRNQIVRLAKPGDILGYRAILSGESYRANAVAIEDSRICFIERTTFLSLLRDNPETALQIMAQLSRDLRKAEERLTSATQDSTRQRVAEAICFLRDEYGSSKNGLLNATLSREELGELADTTRESASRTLKEFTKKSLLKVEKRKLTILKAEALEKLAGRDEADD